MNARSVADRVGATHAHGCYHFSDEHFLMEGARALIEMGTRVIKVFADPDLYPFNSRWPDDTPTLLSVLQTDHFRELFDQPFTTFLVEAFARGVPAASAVRPHEQRETEGQFYDATLWLLEAYAGSGKTFVLQNWEGDWAMKPRLEYELETPPEAARAMVATLNARQAGVDRARRDVGATGAQVYHAAEVNHVARAIEGHCTMCNDVLPHTHCDLYSYSAWDTSNDRDAFRDAVEYLRSKAPPSEAFGTDNVYIGEFGCPENEFGAETQLRVTRDVVEVSLELGLPYVVYWELYCNEPRGEGGGAPGRGSRVPNPTNADQRGFWLIRADGSLTPTCDYLRALLASA